MRRHPTTRSWTPEDCERLQEMVQQGVSAARSSLVLRRSVRSVKYLAKRLGTPLPDARLLKREWRTRQIENRST